MILEQIIKELFKEKTRMILTILAIAWGSFSISIMLAIGEGLRINFAESIINNQGVNLLSITGGSTSKPYKGMPSNININLNKNDVATISKLPNVSTISPYYSFSQNILYKKELFNKEIRAVESNYFTTHKINLLPGGRFISPLDIREKNAVIVLGAKTAEDFFAKNQDPIGQYVFIAGNPFLVIGTMKPQSQITSSGSQNEFLNWIPISTYELYANPRIITSIDIVYKHAKSLAILKQQIQESIALVHNTDIKDTNIINFTDYAKQQKTINNFFIGIEIFLGIVGALTLVVAGVGISNVMYASVKKATHEIGIRMAIGARTFHIIIHYVVEALMATFAGGIIGLILSSSLVYTLHHVTFKNQFINTIGHPELSFLVFFIVISFLGITGTFVGLFPALKAAKIDPTEALSYE